MLCAYDRRTTPDGVLDDINHTHPTLSEKAEGSVDNRAFVAPTTFLDQLAHRDVDAIEAEAPALELFDQLPGTSRRSVAALAENTELERPQIDALALAVGEVVTNAIVHGQPPVVVRAWAPSDRVVVSVVDHGGGLQDPFVGMLPVPSAAGGLGLHVVYQTCSLVTMSRTDEDFTVHLTMHPSPL
jgi:anti-sigma regulatory factor (Ser/Thr protein kinase)